MATGVPSIWLVVSPQMAHLFSVSNFELSEIGGQSWLVSAEWVAKAQIPRGWISRNEDPQRLWGAMGFRSGATWPSGEKEPGRPEGV